jgi:hypothetical protein
VRERLKLIAQEQLLTPLNPNENALTPLFQANIDEPMLREIAEADYGWKADHCYELLEPVLKTGLLAPDDFNVREVLELIRWSEPEDPEGSPGGQGGRGHWMRLFACTELVRLAARSPNSFEGECSTLAQLVSSAIDLGKPVARAGASVLTWRFLASPGADPDSAFLAFGVLLLAVHVEHAEGSGQWLKDLAEWAEDEESRSRNALSTWSSALPHWDRWLTGLTVFHQREGIWRSLAHRILARPERAHPSDANEALQLLGELVAGI